MSRAKAVHSSGLNQVEPLSEDLFRASVVLAVGALDAYLCDAYVDCLSKALQTCRNDPSKKLPSAYAKQLLPAGPLISGKYTQRYNWSLRMAARTVMDKDNLLQVGRLKDLFNPVLPAGEKLWTDLVPLYIALNRKRLTGIYRNNFNAILPGPQKDKARQKAAAAILKRIGLIVQRRHDIVHNCDRPRNAITKLRSGTADRMIRDVESFILILDDHLDNNITF